MSENIEINELLKLDEQSRRTAIETKGGLSFIIEAPAGAGKTELLTQRFLALLLTVNDPEEIIALTFTNKAVAEMRKRIIDSLLMAKSGEAPGQPHKLTTFALGRKVLAHAADRQWDLLDHPGRLQVTTLDALCGKLVRQMPYLSRFGAQPAIATDAAPLYQQAAMATLELLEEEGEIGEAIGRVLGYFDNDSARFAALLESMLANRDQWLRHTRSGMQIEDAQNAFRLLIEDELKEIVAVLPAGMQVNLMGPARFAAASLLVGQASGESAAKYAPLTSLADWDAPLCARVEDLPRWRGLMTLLLAEAGNIRGRFPKEFGFAEAEGKEHAKALKPILDILKESDGADTLPRIRSLPSPEYSDDERQLIRDLYTLLQVAEANLWLVFKAERQVDFAQMSQNALSALGEEESPTDLQLQLDYRISHILVDEFQDTSPTQVELLGKLTAGWQKGDGRTLFLVGDPMQSIYRFRKADVGLFLKVRERGIGDVALTPLSLYRNNRSHQELVEWVNSTFKDVFPPNDDLKKGAVKFGPAAHTKGPDKLARIDTHPIIDQSGGDEAEDVLLDPASKREAQEILSIITQVQTEDPNGTIAVLVRARSHLEALIEELRFHEPRIRYQAVEIEPLYERQSIQDLAALTRALFHLADRINWLAVLRAPWCGLMLADMHALAADQHKTPVWALLQDDLRLGKLSGDGQQRARHVRDVLAEAFANQGRQRPRRFVEGVWQCLGGPLCLKDAGEYQDIVAFFNVLDKLEYRGTLELSRLDAELEKLFAAPDPAASPNVQVMTIHKSKGLEFDTVILPGLHRKSPNADKKLLVWDEVLGEDGQEHLVVAALSLAQDDAPAKSDFLHQFEKSRGDNELQRLLYVAVTRAKRQLHLLGVAKIDKDGSSVKQPATGTCLNLLWDAVGGKFAEAAQAHSSDVEKHGKITVWIDEQTFQAKLVRLANPQCPLPKSESLSAAKLLDGEDARDEAAADEDSAAADVGTLVHRYLEFIATDGLESWSVSRIGKMRPRISSWFSLRGYSAEQSAALSDSVIGHLSTTLESADGRWVLNPREQAGCEVALTQAMKGPSRTHIIDRTFMEEGARWIIDYKTTRIDAKAGDTGVREIAQNYREQLARYEGLFDSAEQPVRLGIFFTSIGRLVEVE